MATEADRLHPALRAVLEEGQRRGLLGPGPVDDHVAHALALLQAAEGDGVAHMVAVDLGSGGGVPGLPAAAARPGTRWVLLDSRQRAQQFLAEALALLQLPLAQLCAARAEVAGRADLRGAADLVVARAFGPPATTAECAAPLLAVGGRLVVSNPPDAVLDERWPEEGLAVLGMGEIRHVHAAGFSFTVAVQASACPDRFPRRVGQPAKRPLF
jgi:16S rRNA (guanine527-N7)-methyltransferase